MAAHDRRTTRRASALPSPAVTGFVGTALVERLLRSVPDCKLVLLVRPSKRHDATERVRREIFKNNAFDRLKAQGRRTGVETFDEMIARRVTPSVAM